MSLGPFWRKLLLVVHVVSSVGLMGAVTAFLVLAIAGLASPDAGLVQAAYRAMPLLTWDVIVPLAFAALLVGIVQSLGTPWGLFRYFWVIVKLVLTLLAVVVLLLQTGTIDGLATAAQLPNFPAPELMEPRLAMVVHGAGGLVVLLVATILSVYKPRGTTRYGARALVQRGPA